MVATVESERVDRVFAALADATRRDILTRVIHREQSVTVLAREYRMSLPAVQKHVAVLERAGLVGKVRQGREVRVHAEHDALRGARALLDEYELLQRHRVAAIDDLLAEDRTGEGTSACPCSTSHPTPTP